ncbi:MAG TPA: NADH-quinone oxidoreductase subunit J [Egibacteraceae bacterium]|nr:NADH-quinone oxidoreductase subunit J [Egibacteraceae bacterium]
MPILAQAAEAAGGSSAELVVFIIVGALSLGSAVSMVMMRNAVHGALMLVVNFFTIAVFYAVNEAQFLATVQIIVYAGAIMVLFLFVIMLLGVDRQDDPTRRDNVRGVKPAAIVFGLVLFTALAVGVAGPYLGTQSACPSPAAAEGAVTDRAACRGLAEANEQGNTEGVGALLFTRYVWPFEVISVLLVIAAIGAMVLGRREEDPADLVDAVAGDTTTEVDSAPTQAEPALIGKGNPAPSSSPTEEDA